MTSLITRLEALRDEQLAYAAWHKARRNVESAATHRGIAAGLSLAIREATAALPQPDTFEEPLVLASTPSAPGEPIPTLP